MLATFAALTGCRLGDDGPDSINVLPALLGKPDKPDPRPPRARRRNTKAHLALREGRWVYIGARGGGGFAGTKPGDHALGGPRQRSSSPANRTATSPDGKIKPDAPDAQLYDLTDDPPNPAT